MNQSICGENLKEQNADMFFVRVKEPTQIRKQVLETLKRILEVLHRFEKFKRIRHEKFERIQKLSSLLKEANKMLGNLKLKLPQTNLKAVVLKEIPPQTPKATYKKSKKTKGKKTKVSEEKIQKKEPIKKEMTDVEKLESELNAIEGKLKNLI